MDSQFHSTKQLSNAELKAFMKRSDQPSLIKFVFHYALLLLGSVLTLLSPYLPWPALWLILGIGIFASMVPPMFAIVHETTHFTAFQSRQWNLVIAWLAALPILYIPSGFREFHFEHHRHTQDPYRDPEISVGGQPAPDKLQNRLHYLAYLSGFPILFYKMGLLVLAALGWPERVWRDFLNYVPKHKRAQLSLEARIALSIHILWIVLGYLWFPGMIALLFGQWLGHLLLSFYTLAEHTGLPQDGSIIERTRTLNVHPLIKSMMWNMPYHAAHHAYPAVPWHHLPKLQEKLDQDAEHPGQEIGSILGFHGEMLRQL